MKIFKKNFNKISLAFLFITAFLYMGAVDQFQSTFVKNDGSGTIKLTYSATEADVTKSNFLIGNYPFEAGKIKEYFSAPGINLKKSEVIKKDGLYYVNAEIDFTTVYKIKDMKGFSGTNSSFIKTDSGMVFYWNLKGGVGNQSGVLEKVTFKFSFEGQIKSTTGVLKNNESVYYRDTKSGNFNSDLFCTATIIPGTSQNSNTNQTQEKGKENTPSGKSCGLFGIELPLIMIGGYVFALNRKRKKQ